MVPPAKPYETFALGHTSAGQSASFQRSAPFHRLSVAVSADSWRVGLEINKAGRAFVGSGRIVSGSTASGKAERWGCVVVRQRETWTWYYRDPPMKVSLDECREKEEGGKENI